MIDGGPDGVYCDQGFLCRDLQEALRDLVVERPRDLPTREEARQRVVQVLRDTGFEAWGSAWYGDEEFAERITEALYGPKPSEPEPK